mmetsp:Transcript_31810/g.69561  ORF Transcript_31810/g.69561 Transcript_31810/m.69561 type:complete len:205 (+) Transcript_31810:2196-2810(+)
MGAKGKHLDSTDRGGNARRAVCATNPMPNLLRAHPLKVHCTVHLLHRGHETAVHGGVAVVQRPGRLIVLVLLQSIHYSSASRRDTIAAVEGALRESPVTQIHLESFRAPDVSCVHLLCCLQHSHPPLWHSMHHRPVNGADATIAFNSWVHNEARNGGVLVDLNWDALRQERADDHIWFEGFLHLHHVLRALRNVHKYFVADPNA